MTITRWPPMNVAEYLDLVDRVAKEMRDDCPADWIKPKPDPLACYDCGLRYGGPGWMDAVVANDMWAKISPTGDEGGILCISCMARRCEALGLESVPCKITSGPLHSIPAAPFDPDGRETVAT